MISRSGWLQALLGPVLSLALGTIPANAAAQQAPRPFDPLTEAERQEAVRLATADPQVHRIAGERAYDVAYAELLPSKPPAAEAAADPMRLPDMPRRAEVLLSIYQGEFTGVRVVVDLQRHAVAQVTQIPARAAGLVAGQPAPATVPFSPREVELARGLAQGDARVRAFTAGAGAEYTLEYLPITSPEPGICPSGRCLEVLFRRGNAYLTTTAVVDVPSQTVRLRRSR
jgi:hypothetical protein